jgi:RNA polymerase subunit RPABC4/transcription elongation factor Spt4
MLGIIVRRLTQADSPKQSELSSSDGDRNQGPLQKWMPHIRKAAFWAASSTLALGWLHQWRQYARAQQRQQQASNLIPPAPQAPPLKLDPRERIRVPENSDVCPLCQQPWIAPSASPAGYVFCHKCLVLYVREHKRCPLTGVQCTEKEIVRIYEPQASAA